MPVTINTLYLPAVATLAVDTVKGLYAAVSASITRNLASVITRGFCWSTQPGATISLSTKTAEPGNGSSYYSNRLRNLMPGTVYYVRAYVTSAEGTVYGNELTFTTLSVTPAVYTNGINVNYTALGFRDTTTTVTGAVYPSPELPVLSAGICWGLAPDPSITSAAFVQSPVVSNSISAVINHLLPNTTYYFRAYAITALDTTYGSNSVAQVWMAKNLDVVTYANGDTIPQVTDVAQWAGLTTGAWCYLRNNSANGTTYGKLYNWYAVNDPRGLAPAGWRIPTLDDFSRLEKNFLVPNNAAGVLKSTTLWLSPNLGASNVNQFKALPASQRSPSTGDSNPGYDTYFWTTSMGTLPYCYKLVYDSYYSQRLQQQKAFGYSVRCIKQ